MKTIYKYTFLVALISIVMLASCQKGFLDKNPNDAISSETFWETESDAKLALAGVYRALQSGFFGHSKLWLDTYSDNAYDRHTFFGFDNLARGIVNSQSVPSDFYNVPYRGIASCNFFLDNIDRVAMSDDVKDKFKAEVRFLRAFFYYDLLQAYGGVIIYKTAPATVEDAKIAKSTKEEVIAFLHEEINFSIANLSDEAYDGHAVKASAQVLKSKLYLYEENWEQAAEFANEVITSGKYQIYQGGYENLFLTATQQSNNEIIFSTKYLAPNNPQGGEGILVEIGWYGAINPYQNLVDEYEMANGKMIHETGSGYSALTPYVNRDPRLRLTIKLPDDPFISPDGSEANFTDPLLTGFSQKKYLDLKMLPYDRTKTPLTDANIVHYRYADVLLMYAEAKNELNGPDATIYSALNQIRSREGVNLPDVDQGIYNSKEKLRDFIRHERRIELALEGQRYFDLKRWGLMEEKLSKLKNPGGAQLIFGEKNNVLPFPQSEMDRNDELKQNVGY